MARRKIVEAEAKVYVLPVKKRYSGEAFLAQVMADAEWKIKSSRTNLDVFKAKLEKDPQYAFEWSKEAFQHAANLRVAQTVLSYVEMLRKQADDYQRKTDLQIIQCIMEEFEKETLRMARWPERSTSPQSNEASLCLNAARAEWLASVKEKFQYLDVY